MKIIVFDTETTGIPSPHLALEDQPHICQFAAILYEFDPEAMSFGELKQVNFLIKPPVIIPADCVILHGITDAMVADKPDFAAYVDEILNLFNQADVAVAHNLSFDQQMIAVELERLGRSGIFLPEQTFDTMKETKEMCRIPGRLGRIKSPRLGELHKFLFAEEMENAHDAIHDVMATARCLEELARRDMFKPQEPVQDSLF